MTLAFPAHTPVDDFQYGFRKSSPTLLISVPGSEETANSVCVIPNNLSRPNVSTPTQL